MRLNKRLMPVFGLARLFFSRRWGQRPYALSLVSISHGRSGLRLGRYHESHTRDYCGAESRAVDSSLAGPARYDTPLNPLLIFRYIVRGGFYSRRNAKPGSFGPGNVQSDSTSFGIPLYTTIFNYTPQNIGAPSKSRSEEHTSELQSHS